MFPKLFYKDISQNNYQVTMKSITGLKRKFSAQNCFNTSAEGSAEKPRSSDGFSEVFRFSYYKPESIKLD